MILCLRCAGPFFLLALTPPAASGTDTPRHWPPGGITRYTIVALRHFGASAEDSRINTRGQIVSGDLFFDGRRYRQLDGPSSSGHQQVKICGISDTGIVAGNLTSSESGAYTVFSSQGVYWRDAQAYPLHLPPRVGGQTAFSDINSQGDLVGQIFDNGPVEEQNAHTAFLYRGGRMTILGDGSALCVNNKRQVVIERSMPGVYRFYAHDKGQDVGVGATDTFLWTRGKLRPILTPPAYGGFNGIAGLNDSGMIAGTLATGHLSRFFTSDTIDHAAVWRDGRTHDLGTLGGESNTALGLNNQGMVVGKSEIALPDGRGGERTHAFFWRGGRLRDLNALLPARSGWVLYEADAVNDRGWIVGAGNKGAFLLKLASG